MKLLLEYLEVNILNTNKLKWLDDEISTEGFWNFLDSIDVDEFFDLRDSDSFDSQWIKNFKRLKKEKFSEEYINFINLLREKAFKFAYRVCQNSEIASYISDDIELVSKDMLLGNEDKWTIVYLWNYYKS